MGFHRSVYFDRPRFQYLIFALLLSWNAFAIPDLPVRYQEHFQGSNCSNPLSMIWWNIREGGELSKKINPRPIDLFLQNLIQKNTHPDFIFLGEYEEESLTPDTEFLLQLFYPYAISAPYNAERNKRFIRVFSKHRFEARESILHWAPTPLFQENWEKSENPRANFYYLRTLINLRVHWQEREFSIFAVHVLNNWSLISKRLGKAKTLGMILYGSDNPHFYQVQNLIQEVRKEQKVDVDQILLGDFNLPDQVFGMIPRSMRNLKKNFNLVGTSGSKNFTFPVIGTDMDGQPKLKIDHFFYRGKLRPLEFKIFDQKGSDHYPIWTTFCQS